MISKISDMIKESFEIKDTAREKTLVISRDVVRNCRTAMFSIHRGDLEKASGMLESSRRMLEEIDSLLEEHPDIYHAGFVEHAQQEYIEGYVLFALVKSKGDTASIAGPEELNVSYAAYLNGLADVIGELRRHTLDIIRNDVPSEGEQYLEVMEEIYACLMMFDFPDAMTHGLRHKTDTARAVIERTRSDLTTAIGQQKLEISMREFKAIID
ncbi:MAG: haloacid dehalogenase [Methanolobus sp.]|uniref:haloacid dehalogenase n=1 Tax=Methanolobus sp. TaxID=1874737 RepID=UPI00272F3968|nr:haloacid dehalogenase [Methanolobus sp.]MDP2217039.1 haloacid dehalogenase [Methanolobus sp.]